MTKKMSRIVTFRDCCVLVSFTLCPAEPSVGILSAWPEDERVFCLYTGQEMELPDDGPVIQDLDAAIEQTLRAEEAAYWADKERRVSAVHLRDVSGEDDEPCWVPCAKGDPGAVLFLPAEEVVS